MKSNKQIELLQDMSVYTEFESNIRGGLTSVVNGDITFNNTFSLTLDLQKPISTGIFLNLNALYATVLSGKTPLGAFKKLSEQE